MNGENPAPIAPLTVVEAGRRGGLVKSDRKAKAVRRNGKKGGRPKKVEQSEPTSL